MLHIFRAPFPKNNSGWLLLRCDKIFSISKVSTSYRIRVNFVKSFVIKIFWISPVGFTFFPADFASSHPWPHIYFMGDPLLYHFLARWHFSYYVPIFQFVTPYAWRHKTRRTRKNLTWISFSGSRPEVFCKKGILKFSQDPQENIWASVSFLMKFQASACNLIKKETLAQLEFCETSRTLVIKNTSGQLLLIFQPIDSKIEKATFTLFTSKRWFTFNLLSFRLNKFTVYFGNH